MKRKTDRDWEDLELLYQVKGKKCEFLHSDKGNYLTKLHNTEITKEHLQAF